jgi:hypothetical protein
LKGETIGRELGTTGRDTPTLLDLVEDGSIKLCARYRYGLKQIELCFGGIFAYSLLASKLPDPVPTGAFNGTPDIWHFRDYPVTGHIPDITNRRK